MLVQIQNNRYFEFSRYQRRFNTTEMLESYQNRDILIFRISKTHEHFRHEKRS